MKKATKQVIVIRKDLNMRKGKMVAQGSHASLAVFTSMIFGYPFKWHRFPFNLFWFVVLFFTHDAMRSWLVGSFTKICVYVESEEELKRVYEQAFSKKIPCSYIVDKGLTEFGGHATPTAVAVGPDWSHKVDEVTGGLPLL